MASPTAASADGAATVATTRRVSPEPRRFPNEARAIARKLEFHYTSKHGSWLNIAEIRIGSSLEHTSRTHRSEEAKLGREGEADVRERNENAVPVNWRFTTQDAWRKLARL
jgi:hypothetical protein